MDEKYYAFILNFDVFQKLNLSIDVNSRLRNRFTKQPSLLLQILKVMKPRLAKLHLLPLFHSVLDQIIYLLYSLRKMAYNKIKVCILWYLMLNFHIINYSILMKSSRKADLQHPISHFACRDLIYIINT